MSYDSYRTYFDGLFEILKHHTIAIDPVNYRLLNFLMPVGLFCAIRITESINAIIFKHNMLTVNENMLIRGNNKVLFWIFALFCCILLHSCALRPPRETGIFEETDLVELVKLDTTLKLDIRYATKNNLVGRPVYTEAKAFLQRPAAKALIKVNDELKTLGYRLLVFDGYRPWSVTKMFWDITSKQNKKFVANPKKGSRHNRGCAVDLSLYDIAGQKEVQMPGEYDEMSERSYPNSTAGTEEQRKMRDLLRSKMESNGFTVYEFEWWHFDFKDWKAYSIQNIPFSAIK